MLAVLVAAVVVAVGLLLVQSSKDDDGDGAGAGEAATLEQVGRAFVDAARFQECDTLVGLISQNWLAGLGDNRADQIAACQQTQLVPYEVAVTDVVVTSQQQDHATLELRADVPGGTDTISLDLVREDGGWKVDPTSLASAVANDTADARPTGPDG